MIDLKSLHKYFNKGRSNEIHVINDMTLALPEKGLVALFGQSGCGKTTLLNVIGGLDGFDSGSAEVAGEDILRDTDTIRNRSIGYIFQNYNLLNGETVGNNVANALRLCGMRDEAVIEARVRAALANVGMEKYISRTPDTLSGGQQQRVAIARAIVKNPSIILADEPTGNLDEANTVMVMDLLKEISRDHLVVLVTHEGDLVDSYCDRVIELSDGRLVGERTLSGDSAYAARSKNDIWLGELDHSRETLEFATVDFYGPKPDAPLSLRIVAQNGRYYLEAPNLHFLDETSEVRLREGSFQQQPDQKNELSAHIDMSALPAFEGKHFGRLFTLKTAVKSGYAQQFGKKKKKGSKALKACLILFAAIQVVMVAMFGTAFQDIRKAKRIAGKSVFYVTAGSDENVKLLTDAVGRKDSGILAVSFQTYRSDASSISFTPGYFETFDTTVYNEDFTVGGYYVPARLLEGASAVAGSLDGLGEGDLVITTAAADTLLDASPFSFIHDYDDLIGLQNCGRYIGSREVPLRVAAIVRSDENLFYVSDIDLTKLALSYADYSPVRLSTDSPYSVKEGECTVLIIYQGNLSQIPTTGGSITLRGRQFRVADVKFYEYDYEGYVNRCGYKLPTANEYFLSQYPELSDQPEELKKRMDEEMFSYYENIYYAYFDEYLDVRYYVSPDCEVWLALKGYDAGRAYFMNDSMYPAYCFRKENGRFPSLSELEEWSSDHPCELWMDLNTLEWEEGLYNQYIQDNPHYLSSDYAAILNPADYGTMAYTNGPNSINEYERSMYDYAQVLSSDPARTESWLKQNIIIDESVDYPPAIVTPQDRYDDYMMNYKSKVTTDIVTLIVLLSLMSLCMYFMMRSSLMSRIREVGIYRAIGVSRSNLLFRFAVEALVLFALTVFLGFLGASVILWFWLNYSAAMAGMFFYPLWLAVALLVLLFVVSLVCSILPVLLLLRKTPAQILAKYDI